MKIIAIVALWALLAQGLAEEALAGGTSPVKLLAIYESASALTLAALWAQFRPDPQHQRHGWWQV